MRELCVKKYELCSFHNIVRKPIYPKYHQIIDFTPQFVLSTENNAILILMMIRYKIKIFLSIITRVYLLVKLTG